MPTSVPELQSVVVLCIDDDVEVLECEKSFPEMVGTTRSRVSFFMNKFKALVFIDYGDGNGLHVHSSLLNVVLHD